MTALPDTLMPDGPLRQQRQTPTYYIETEPADGLRHGVLRFVAAASLAAAAGLWLIPVMPFDALMQVVKVVASIGLGVLGVVLLLMPQDPPEPEVHIDTQKKHLIIVERDTRGRICAERCHAIDTLGDIVLRDRLLTARDANGDPLIALPVTDPSVHAALTRMLAGAAA